MEKTAYLQTLEELLGQYEIAEGNLLRGIRNEGGEKDSYLSLFGPNGGSIKGEIQALRVRVQLEALYNVGCSRGDIVDYAKHLDPVDEAVMIKVLLEGMEKREGKALLNGIKDEKQRERVHSNLKLLKRLESSRSDDKNCESILENRKTPQAPNSSVVKPASTKQGNTNKNGPWKIGTVLGRLASNQDKNGGSEYSQNSKDDSKDTNESRVVSFESSSSESSSSESSSSESSSFEFSKRKNKEKKKPSVQSSESSSSEPSSSESSSFEFSKRKNKEKKKPSVQSSESSSSESSSSEPSSSESSSFEFSKRKNKEKKKPSVQSSESSSAKTSKRKNKEKKKPSVQSSESSSSGFSKRNKMNDINMNQNQNMESRTKKRFKSLEEEEIEDSS